ncbi:PepSY-associated TM helix domain-containing protein [Variovorax ginsengisoli]|uniref:Iron-regulated membrane protein n=1 Tax=Variovorax ginsengisoli TaxID=363844 RepID=A0ABT9S8M2_9BURK|nr:PepSY-associated TM helix domain-containing protein [Variovorax ginsengisoli]MDP9900702.1 putative iron-regulated membrane protein [Variovorax ginsengisoli]
MRRDALVRLHRWLGLAMAGFLLITALTGSLLAWNDELEAWLAPELFVASPSGPPIDPLVLREAVLRAHPEAQAPYQPLAMDPGRTVVFFLVPRRNPATGVAPTLRANQVFIDPYTGQIRGERHNGRATGGLRSVMPVVYLLHRSLAAGNAGALVLGAVALLWTFDCFIGLWLTLPMRATPGRRSHRSWLSRWAQSWRFRWSAGAYKLHVDLHRAGGLWTWGLLLMLAVSSVALTLPSVYDSVTRSLLAHQPDELSLPLVDARRTVAMDWISARESGRRLMHEQAAVQGFTVRREDWMFFDASRGVFRYAVRSDRDVGQRYTRTLVFLDGYTGELRGTWLPAGAASADTLRSWLTRLHMASVGGAVGKLLLSLAGVVVALLCVTGIVIWQRKRVARNAAKCA